MFAKRKRLALALAITLGITCGCSDEAGHEGKDPAWSAYARGEYDAAEATWRDRRAEAQRRGATDEAASALCSLSMIYERRGALQDAEVALKQCLAEATPRGPTWTIAVQRLAQFYNASGDAQRARAVLADAMAEFDGDSPRDRAMRSELLLKVASLHQREGEAAEAESAYRKSIELAEDTSVASSTEAAGWRGLVNLYEMQGRMGDALDACKHWLALMERLEPTRVQEAQEECSRLR